MNTKEINKSEVIRYFNDRAGNWDACTKKSDAVINQILDNCQIGKDSKVLDVATGTGILFDFYLAREARAIGIDISDGMIEIAKKKYPDILFLVADGESFNTEERFDAIVIYNAFPHFSNPEALIENLSRLLKVNGCLSIAHGASRDAINNIHHGGAEHVSNGLMDIDDLAKLFEKYLKVEIRISDANMYQIVGRRTW